MHQTTQGLGREPEAKDISPEPTRDILNTNSHNSSTAAELAAVFEPTRRIGHWSLLAVDSSGKRATVQCACGKLCFVSLAEIESGFRNSCGCRPASPEQSRELRSAKLQRQQRRDQDWRIGRDR